MAKGLEMVCNPVIDIKNVQGDIWPGLPKRFETFLFFQIRKPEEFRTHLKSFADSITTAEKVIEMRKVICQEQDDADMKGRIRQLKPLPGRNIAFSSTGLEALGKFTFDEEVVKKDRNLYKEFRKNQLRGGLYQKGMYDDLVNEGWDDPTEIRDEYKPVGAKKKRSIDGVILVTSSLEDDLKAEVCLVKEHFGYAPNDGTVNEGATIDIVLTREGKTRPMKGKEHFGFQDNLSQPQIQGLDAPTNKETDKKTNKEPKAVLPGLIFLGNEGDKMGQPEWARDGSFLVFRDLQQLVPEFDKFLEDNAHQVHATTLSPPTKEKLAAHLMGRWKNGTPVDLSPHSPSDEEIDKNNNFDYEPINVHKCPFAAHTRKMRPRGDLNDDHAVIIRRGISYGDEVTPEEWKARKSDDTKERGLLFVCYQSDIRSGFNFLTTRWASNHHFPDRKAHLLGGHGPGIDAIVGQKLSHHPPRSICLPDGKVPTETHLSLDRWVIPRGGEYFFTPSIAALRGYLASPPAKPASKL
ncbi:hypothetical protein BDV28DRAFT_144699 [Aspergillus coremiiformis]|uniref:Dyp-type peroxidase n=1 Tax=Aspergillus coremiiformis TaxID=138285 RepID=A0A5N6ZJ99_9EURO|nr:hypothetical protein BDV28DRAFT_144699 [Aspergillus coremiiformis]